MPRFYHSILLGGAPGSRAIISAVILSALVLLDSCSKPLTPTPTPSPTPAPTPLPTPIPTSSPIPTPIPSPTETPPPTPTPTVTPTPTPAPTVPVVEQKADVQGVYYVLKDTTVQIPGGLIGLSLGTEVTLVAGKKDRILFTNGRDQFELSKTQVTNDPKVSADLVKRASEIQSSQDQYKAQQDAILIKQQQAEIEYLRVHPLGTAAPGSLLGK